VSREMAGWVRGEPGADVVEELCRAGVVRGDLVGLAVAPRVGLGMATTTGKMSVARGIEDPSEVVRFVEEALGPRWVLWSNEHRGDASPGRGADRDVLGPSRGASASLRRMAGPIPLVCGRSSSIWRLTRSRRPRRRTCSATPGARRRSGRSDPSRRAHPAGVVGQRLVRDSGTASAVGGAGGEGRSAPAGAPRRTR